MLAPFLGAWIEERSKFTTLRINRSNVRTFETIAIETSPRQVVEGARAAVFRRDDVIGFVREVGLCFR